MQSCFERKGGKYVNSAQGLSGPLGGNQLVVV